MRGSVRSSGREGSAVRYRLHFVLVALDDRQLAGYLKGVGLLQGVCWGERRWK